MKIPIQYLCPISLEIMSDPVICYDGHTYDRQSILKFKNPISPITGQIINLNIMIPNIALKCLIDEFKKKTLQNSLEYQNNVEIKKIIIGYNPITGEILEVNENIDFLDLSKYFTEVSTTIISSNRFVNTKIIFLNLNLLYNLKKIILTHPSDLFLFNNTLQYLEEIYFFGMPTWCVEHKTNIGLNVKFPGCFGNLLYNPLDVSECQNVLIYPKLKKIILSEEYNYVSYTDYPGDNTSSFSIDIINILKILRTNNKINFIFKNKNIIIVKRTCVYNALSDGTVHGYSLSNIQELNLKWKSNFNVPIKFKLE